MRGFVEIALPPAAVQATGGESPRDIVLEPSQTKHSHPQYCDARFGKIEIPERSRFGSPSVKLGPELIRPSLPGSCQAGSAVTWCYDSRGYSSAINSSIMVSSSANSLKRLLIMAATGCALAQCVSSAAAKSSTGHNELVATVRVDADPKHVLTSFDPDRALGSSLDVLSRVGIDKVHSPHIVQESLAAGWGPITYRNNTELRMGAWHWNENGTWSDAAHQSGYFTGSTELKKPTRYILAYALPHRGFSTSGDAPVPGPNLSYWKSNPYLTRRFTGGT